MEMVRGNVQETFNLAEHRDRWQWGSWNWGTKEDEGNLGRNIFTKVG